MSPTATEISALDNPIWHALIGPHARFAEGGALAARFLPEVGPLAGLAMPSGAALDALSGLLGPGDAAALFLPEEFTAYNGWNLLHADVLYQMVADGPLRLVEGAGFRVLTAADVPQMVALAELTEPGPFRRRTAELGRFVGIERHGSLAAMSGERLRLDGFTEVSAVCTHPDHRGHGYAALLMSEIMRGILNRGETPFLHVRASNASAIGLYRKLGFAVRRTLYLSVVGRSAG